MTPTQTYYNDLLFLAGKINLYILLIPIVVGIYYWKNLNVSLKIFLYFKLADLVYNFSEIIFIYTVKSFASFKKIIFSLDIHDTSFLGIFGLFITYYFIGRFYSKLLEKPTSFWIRWSSWFLLLLSIIIYFFIDGYNKQGSVNQTVYRFYIGIVPILYVGQIFQSKVSFNLWKNSYFLISLGLLIPNLLSVIMSIVSDNIHENNFPLFVKLSLIRNGFGFFSEIIFAYAFFNARYVNRLK